MNAATSGGAAGVAGGRGDEDGNGLKAPKAGKVVEITKVKPGQTVEKGELLLVVE